MMVRNELAVIVAKVMASRGFIDIMCYGDAMYPLVQDGNVSTFVKVREKDLQIGDVCLFVNKEGQLLLYRIIDLDDEQHPAIYTFRADTYDVPELPVSYSQIIGKLKAVHRDGRAIYVHHWRSRLIEAAVLQIPYWTKISRWAAHRRYDRTSAIGNEH